MSDTLNPSPIVSQFISSTTSYAIDEVDRMAPEACTSRSGGIPRSVTTQLCRRSNVGRHRNGEAPQHLIAKGTPVPAADPFEEVQVYDRGGTGRPASARSCIQPCSRIRGCRRTLAARRSTSHAALGSLFILWLLAHSIRSLSIGRLQREHCLKTANEPGPRPYR